jgi:hypothetical protein
MNRRAWAVLAAALLLMAAGGQPSQAELQIRERIASIRAAILARQAEGIVRWGTPDWQMIAADGTRYDKAAYLVRARALMDRIVTVDSLTTAIDAVATTPTDATVELTQTMERHERDAASGAVVHLRMKYRERHTWVKTDDGWRVKVVLMLPGAERQVLNDAGAKAK